MVKPEIVIVSRHPAAQYLDLTMEVPASKRGQELSVEDMEAAGCKLKEWIVHDILDS